MAHYNLQIVSVSLFMGMFNTSPHQNQFRITSNLKSWEHHAKAKWLTAALDCWHQSYTWCLRYKWQRTRYLTIIYVSRKVRILKVAAFDGRLGQLLHSASAKLRFWLRSLKELETLSSRSQAFFFLWLKTLRWNLIKSGLGECLVKRLSSLLSSTHQEAVKTC